MSGKHFGLAVRAIIMDDQGRSLLVRRSLASTYCPGQWEWPGGKVDPGEDAPDALLREVEEECGLQIQLTGFAGAVDFVLPHVHAISLCFEARVLTGTPTLSDEHERFAWVPLRDLADHELTEHARAFMLDYATKMGTEQ